MRPLPFSALLVLSSVPLCAVAEPTEYATVVAQPDVRSKTVRFADLNLQRHEGVVVLYRRIRNAADLVCFDGDRRSLQSELNVRRCTTGAVTRAVEQVGLPALSTLHAQQSGDVSTTMLARQSR